MGEPARHTEGSRGARRRLLRAGRTATLLGGVLALIGVPGAPAAVAASPDYPAAVTITGVQQTPDGKLDVFGTVSNPGPTPLQAPKVGLTLGHNKLKLETRSDIGAMLSRTDPVYQDGTQLPAPVQQLTDLAAGGSVPFHLPTTLSDLKLDGNGYYELAVDVEAGTNDDSGPHQVGIARTTLAYYPNPGSEQPLQVATLWPLTHAPELVPQTVQDNDQAVLRDDSLATDLGPNGRLGRLLTTGQDMPGLSWVIDPDLLDAVQAMTKPYRVLVPPKPGQTGQSATETNTVPGTGTAAATAWLNQLRSAVVKPGDQVIALPYGDPDLASIAHSGGALPDRNTFLSNARDLGKITVDSRLPGVDSTDTVAWPYQGYLDPQIQQTTQQLGATQVLVNSASLPDRLTYSPSAARPIGGDQTAVVADSTIATLFRDDLKASDRKSQAQQRFLAETFAIQQQQPAQRTLLVMPPRDLSADTAEVLKASLKAATDGHWISQVAYDKVAGATPDPRADSTVAGPDAYPADLRGSELPAGTFDRIAQTEQNEQLLLRILTNPTRVSQPFAQALTRATSTQWRGGTPAASDYLENTRKYLETLQNAVRIPFKSKTITLAGDSGLLQVSVRNELQQGVTNLELVLTSGQPNRLKVTSRHPITLDQAQSISARFQAQALGNGAVPMTAQLWTTGPDPQMYGDEVHFTVQVTQVTSGVWWVVGAGAALVLAAGLRIFLKRRKRGDEPPEDPDAPLTDPDGPDDAEADPDAPVTEDRTTGAGAGGRHADPAVAHP